MKTQIQSLQQEFIQECTVFGAWLQKNAHVVLALYITAFLSKFFYWSTHRSFTQDQVRDYLYIQNLIESQNFFIPLGPAAASYSNFSTPPLYYYFQLFAQWIGQGWLYSIDIFVILTEAATPILLFWLLQKIWQSFENSKEIGPLNPPFLFTLLYIFSPFVIVFSTAGWNPNLVPFWSLVLIIAGLRYIISRKNLSLVVAMIAGVVLLNLHFQAFVFAPFFLFIAVIAIARLKQTWSYILIGIGAVLALMAPYLWFEITNNWQNTTNTLVFLQGSPDAPIFERLRVPRFVLFFFSGFYTRFFSGETILGNWTRLYEFPEITVPMIAASGAFWGVLSAAAISSMQTLSWSSLHFFQKKLQKSWPLAVGILFTSMVITLRMYKGDKPDYYLLTFSAFGVILLLLALQILKKSWRSYATYCVFMIILSAEFFTLIQIPQRNQFADFSVTTEKIRNLPSQNVSIIPMNQELIVPLTYFFDRDQLDEKPNTSADFVVFLCPNQENCIHFIPNSSSTNNMAKYDLITPVNYSFSLPENSKVDWNFFTQKTDSLQMKIIDLRMEE